MSDPIKLQESELEELKKIQSAYQDKTFEFGQLYIEKLNQEEREVRLKTAENKIKKELTDIQKLEQDWVDAITTKYGNGNLNIKNGTFTPQ